MADPPSPIGLSYARLKPIVAEAVTRARRVGVGFTILVAVIGAALSWYIGEPVRGSIVTIVAALGAFPLVCAVEFYRVAREKDRGVILPLLRVIGEVAVACLCIWLVLLGWRQHREIGGLSRAAVAEREQRIEIARDGERLAKLWIGKGQFESAVKGADAAWENVETEGKRELSSPQQITVPFGLSSAMRLWQTNGVGPVLSAARNALGQQVAPSEIEGHSDHFNISLAVQGEENMSNEWNRRLWREAYDRHLKVQEFIGNTRGKISSEIDALTKKLMIAAGCKLDVPRPPNFNLCPG